MRQVIHIDLDAFYASVEMLLNPQLRDKPLIVAMGSLESRGVVATASYEARKFGVHSAMPLREATRLCPQAVIVPVRHAIYSEHSQKVMSLLREYSPLLEQVSIDEAYLEIGPEREAAHLAPEIQRRIKQDFGLDCTLAVASNKLVSKIACNTVKPRGLTVVAPGDEKQFLAPLPVAKIPGAGYVTRSKLARWNVQTIGDLARLPVAELRAEFGKHGVYLHEAAEGRDESPIVTDAKTKSISQENTFERDTRDAARIEHDLLEMSRGVAEQLDSEGYIARTIVVKLRFADFTTITRQTTLRMPTADAGEISACAQQLFRTHWDPKRAVRLVGVGAHNLVEASAARQMELGL
jgi:DNA polymerase IV